ncbi:MAG TPA: 2-C-methyl-D-erythritol 4-phosphate cytidylyltransferase [bacterium]|nr:2-C-methyl-D-erythritol 4-phosphate cytidylyltransferase [bacterium]
MISAIIAAAGTGERMKAETPKVFLQLKDKNILFYSLATISKVEEIEHVTVAVPGEWIQTARDTIAGIDGLKSVSIIEGGSTRQETVFKALQELPEDTKTVVVHDGARPLASVELFRAVIACAREHGACVPSLPCQDTVKIVRGGLVEQTLDRNEVHIIQTPQAFYYDSLLQAHQLADEWNWRVTDDSSLIERAGRPVTTVNGESGNIKITHPGDILSATLLLK